ncbi:metallophosphoesterase [Sphingomonas sp.]|uniref:metallophosphoesterase n=1 Tax=Sphingomonas sp. TaxID=28214 RepID=UPI0028A92BEE|nr:metallophosphoesterase [Sphingomonas sp.]
MTAKILHISDIHFHAGSESDFDPDTPFRDAIVEKVRQSAAEAKFDCIFFTGDVAGRGAQAEYVVAKKWLDNLATVAGCGTGGVYVVPGNHDVDRAVARDVLLVQLAQRAVVEAGEASERERQLARAMESSDTGPALFRPLANYNDFASSYGCEIGPAERGLWTRFLALDHGYRLKIFGMTSVLFSSCKPAGGDDTRAQNLYVGPPQQVFRHDLGEIVVSLIHHPADWLLDTVAQERALRDRSVLHFEGHVHDRLVVTNPRHMRFAAGAVSPNRYEASFEPGFNIVQLDVVKEDDDAYFLEVEAQVWAWQDNPGRFRLHLDHGDQNWRHRIPLPAIPAGAAPMMATDRLPPPAPRETAGMGPAIQRFWELPGSAKARIAGQLDLLTEDERRLPERYRYTNIFSRAATRGQAEALVEAIRAEGEKA